MTEDGTCYLASHPEGHNPLASAVTSPQPPETQDSHVQNNDEEFVTVYVPQYSTEDNMMNLPEDFSTSTTVNASQSSATQSVSEAMMMMNLPEDFFTPMDGETTDASQPLQSLVSETMMVNLPDDFFTPLQEEVTQPLVSDMMMHRPSQPEMDQPSTSGNDAVMNQPSTSGIAVSF